MNCFKNKAVSFDTCLTSLLSILSPHMENKKSIIISQFLIFNLVSENESQGWFFFLIGKNLMLLEIMPLNFKNI